MAGSEEMAALTRNVLNLSIMDELWQSYRAIEGFRKGVRREKEQRKRKDK